MSNLGTADGFTPSADSLTGATADTDRPVPIGWPCALLSATPPSVADRQSAPGADDLLPQVLTLAPRGPAWGTDEAGDGSGASPLMRRFWRALAAWSADNNARDWSLATQVFPSAIVDSLPDWEAELALPDPCFRGGSGAAARITAVRARFAAQGGQSPAYFICLAASVGYTVTITEPMQFLLDVSALTGDSIVEDWFRVDDGQIDATPLISFALPPLPDQTDPIGADSIIDADFRIDDGEIDTDPLDGYALTALIDDEAYSADEWKYWVVHVGALGATAFHVDDGRIDLDPLEGFLTAADLECLLRHSCPPHTRVVFSYASA